MSSQIKNHKLITTVDSNGNHVMQDEWVSVSKTKKCPGFRLVYIDRLKEFLLNFNSSKVIYIVLDMLSEEVGRDFILKMDYRKLADMYGVSEVYAKSILKTMKDNDMIRGSRGMYKVNPYIIIPSKVTDTDVSLEQDRWDDKDSFNAKKIDSYETPMVSPDEADYYEPDELDELD